jgi:hypothetical protein
MNMKYKKSLKIVTLLVTALLIATASAQVYRYMFINGTVTIGNTGLTWVLGEEAPTGTSISGSTVTLALPVSNGTIANFTHVLYLKNLDASLTHSLSISITDPANSALYDSFNMTISNNSTGALIHKLDVTTTDTYSDTIDTSAIWQMSFEIQTKTDATAGDDLFSIQLSYE